MNSVNPPTFVRRFGKSIKTAALGALCAAGLLLNNPSAHAQGWSVPSTAYSWAGTTSYSLTKADGTLFGSSAGWGTSFDSMIVMMLFPGDHGTMTANGTVTVTPTGPATPSVNFLVWSVSGYDISLSATSVNSATGSNGFGDTYVQSPNSGVSSGKHIITMDGSSGSVTIPVTLAATATVSVPTRGLLSKCFMDHGLNVVPDPRSLNISCPTVDTVSTGGRSDGGSKYREPPLTGPIITNYRAADGTLRGDTYSASPAGWVSETYTAHSTGSWASGSDWHWYESLAGNFSNGVLPGITDFSMGITGGFDEVVGADNIFLSLNASNDAARATASYNLHVHHEWEPATWPINSTYKVMGPDSEMPAWQAYPWKKCDDPVLTITYPSTQAQFHYSQPGLESVDSGLDLGKEPVVAHFGFTYRTGTEIDASPVVVADNLSPGYYTWVVWRENVTRQKGYLDHYGVHGYMAKGAWCHDQQLGVDTNVYDAQLTTQSIVEPPAGWNPPDYNP